MNVNEIPEYQVPKEDNWYKWKGVKPPERTGHGIIDDDEHIQQLLANNLKEHVCDWQQDGSRIYCQAGNFEHGKFIGTAVRLGGTDDKNQPVLVPVGPILRSEIDSA